MVRLLDKNYHLDFFLYLKQINPKYVNKLILKMDYKLIIIIIYCQRIYWTSGRRRSGSSKRSDITIGPPPIDHRVRFSASPPRRFRFTKCHLAMIRSNISTNTWVQNDLAHEREKREKINTGENIYLRIRIP
jgi:hypothetical protein